MASTMDRTSVLTAFEALSSEDKWWMAENIMSILRGAGPLKPRGRKPKADKDGSSEGSGKKRSKANLHNILTHVVKPALMTASEEAADEKTARLMKKGRAQKAVSQVFVDRFAEMENDAAEAAVKELTAEEVITVFQDWSKSPEANKPRKPRSTASSGSESKLKKPKLSNMTEEEKKAFYKARGEAAAAARAAKKAAAAENADDSDAESDAESETSEAEKASEHDEDSNAAEAEEENSASDSESDSEAESEDGEPVAVRPYIWEHAMEGKEMKKFERVDIEGKAYLYHYKTKEYLGMWNEKKNKIKKDEPNPCA